MNHFRTERKPVQAQAASPSPDWLAWIRSYRKRLKGLDPWLLGLSAGLIVFGLVMVYSATMYVKDSGQVEPLNYLIKQGLAVLLGLLAGGVILALPMSWIKNYRNLFLANILACGLLWLIALVVDPRGGASSWINILGMSLQLSEFAKFLMIALAAYTMHRVNREVILGQEEDRLKTLYYQTLGVVGASGIAILIQPDFGMFLITGGAIVIMLMVGFFSTWQVGQLFLGLSTGYVFLRWLASRFSDFFVGQGLHIFKRIGIFTDPFKYFYEEGYQLVNGYLAMSRGGWWGQGLGNSLTKQETLPAAHTDFIFAVIVEELGYIRTMLFLLVLILLIARIFILAAKARDSFNQLMIAGIGGMLLVQTFTNIGGVLGLIPLTGVTIPFVSYGGSSMLSSIMALSLVQRLVIDEKEAGSESGLHLVHSRYRERQERD